MTRNILTVRQFAESCPALTEAGIRWQIFNAKTNGLDESGAILRMGSRVLIDADRWYAWLDRKNGIKIVAA